jgi:hypothetical protein
MNMNNQNGYTLITTLLIATLIVTVSFVLIGMALNTNKQIQLSEQEMQATDLAEMGVTYFQEKVNEIVTKYNNANDIPEDIANDIDDIANEINDLDQKIITVQSTSSKIKQFKIALDSLLINKDNLSAQVTFYGCVGNCEDPTSKKETIRSTVELILNTEEGTGNTVVIAKGTQEVEVKNCNDIASQDQIKKQSCFFRDQVDLNEYLSKQKQNELTINKATVYFFDSVTIESLKLTGNSNKLCVYGTLQINKLKTGNPNFFIYAYQNLNNNIPITEGENNVKTSCGTYSFDNNNGNWTSKLTNIQYD